MAENKDSADVSIIMLGGDQADATHHVDPESGALITEQADGSVVIQFDPEKPDDGGDFYENLAEKLSSSERQAVVEELLQGIDSDDRSRESWLKTRALGIEMLGFRLEEPRTDAGGTGAPLEGMSVVRHTLLPEAVIRFQANSAAELLPAGGPVKVRDDTPPMPQGVPPEEISPVAGLGHNGGPKLDADDDDDDDDGLAAILSALSPPTPTPLNIGNDGLAEALERDFNHYLTVIDKAYRSDTVRMLFDVGFGGCAFKKVYNCPVKRRPVSRTVDAKDLIVSNDVCDFEDAGRITHRVRMRKSLLRRMQIAGAYRDIELGQPSPEVNDADRAMAAAQGFAETPQRAEDYPYVIDECYCELDIDGLEPHKENGKATGLPLPYKVSIERTSRQLLELRRNWRQDDDTYTAKRVFVRYVYLDAMGFYGIGLLHILGNADRALTAAWREMLDAGMFANFPGFLYRKTAARQMTNEMRVAPGSGIPIETNGDPIQSSVMPVPYKEPSAATLGLIQHIEEMGQRIGGIGEVPVGEGKQDAPVGTTLALIEQATKVIASVHVGLHNSQSEEFQLLRERFQEDPEAFWRFNRRPARKWERELFLKALDNYDLVPAADPNTASHMHRIMKAIAVKQLQAMRPELYDPYVVDRRILSMIGFSNPDELFVPPPPPQPPSVPAIPPDPNKIAELQQKAAAQANEHQGRMAEIALKTQAQQQDHQARLAEAQADAAEKQHEAQLSAQESAVESADRAADRASHERVAGMKLQADREKTEAMRDAAQARENSAAPAAEQGVSSEEPQAPGVNVYHIHNHEKEKPPGWPRPI